MRSINFNFGNNIVQSEGKGADWLFDRILQKTIAGQAGFDYEIIKTSPDIVAELLSTKYSYDKFEMVFKSYTFYTLFLSMSIKMSDPAKWILSWARFEFELNGQVSVISFTPNVDGIKTTIEKNGSRELNLSLSAELGLPETNPLDLKLSPEITYNKNRGWKVKYNTMVEEVKGFKTRTTTGKINLQWDIYNNKAIQIPESNIGKTSGIYATALISTPKNSEGSINVKVSGTALSKGLSIMNHGLIELASINTFNIEPTL